MAADAITPDRIRVEACSVCQLKCPSCPTARGEVRRSVVGSGRLKAASFERLLEENPSVRRVELSNWGEIFLNPDLIEILRIAHALGVRITASNGANLNNVRDEALEAVVTYRMEHLTCSIDGASQETYGVYRRGGNFATVVANVHRIVELKAQHDSPYPRLTWQFVVFGHNEHELPMARQMAEQLGMAFRPKLSWDEQFSPIRDPEFVQLQTGIGAASRSEYRNKTSANYRRSTCLQLWREPQVNFDGELLGCCVNRWGTFGNVFSDGLLPSVNNDMMRYARAMLMGRVPPRKDIPCTTCSRFRDMQRYQRYLTDEEVARNS